MAIDREDALKKAEKLLRQGRLDAAIAEYVRVVEGNPRDWNTANTLGDLYVRAGDTERAAAQYGRIARHFLEDGFYSKAAALYKKILKIHPDDEDAQLQLAEASARQGLLADAKNRLIAVAAKRRARGDQAGAREIVIRLGSLDPNDLDLRMAAARAEADTSNGKGAARRFRELAVDLEERDRPDDAIEALKEAARLDPDDVTSRARLARLAIASGRFDEARDYLTREVAAGDPALLRALADAELRAGRLDEGLSLVRELVEGEADRRADVVHLGLNLCDTSADAAFACVDAAVDRAVAAGEWNEAAGYFEEFVARVPHHVPALLKLVEICVDGGLEDTMYLAQTQLTDAYLNAGQGIEACIIAEDLVAREPWEPSHIDRFRRALTLSGTPNADAIIAERLSGETPFTATDPFAEPLESLEDGAGDAASGLPAPEPEPPVPAGPAEASEPVALAPAVQPPGGGPPGQVDPAFQITMGGIDLGSILEGSPGQGEPGSNAEPPPSAESGAGGSPLEAPPAASPSLDRVFRTLRQEADTIEERERGTRQIALAETYVEMGMLDEAVDALLRAVRSPRYRFQAAAALGRIYKQKGHAIQAVEWMERAAQAPPPSPDEGRELLYELGITLEELGETARALAVFLELQADAGSFRDVAARVDRLARVQTGG